jgi:photosystem II stability/assembly factor-like uncharacterized protein
VPSGFDPVSFTAISGSDFWLLGDAPCSNPVCTSIVRTTDGGAQFVGIPAPAVALEVGESSTGISTLRFADALDAYAYGSGGNFWDTHDGGAHWTQPTFLDGRSLLAFGTGAGYAFALVGSCSAQSGNCTGLTLLRSPVSSDQWSALALPVTSASGPATMTIHGADLWISVSTGANQPDQLLLAGTSSGAHFTTSASPCFAGLGGSVQATSADVLWAVCPTGMMAEALRSTDGGATWEHLSLGQADPNNELENSAILAPTSDSTAVLEPASQGELLRTTDGGSTWKTVSTGTSAGFWSWIGFTDANTGAALQTESTPPANWPWPNGPSDEKLWRTSDGGATWTGPLSIG